LPTSSLTKSGSGAGRNDRGAAAAFGSRPLRARGASGGVNPRAIASAALARRSTRSGSNAAICS
jgi:hypothetical protein